MDIQAAETAGARRVESKVAIADLGDFGLQEIDEPHRICSRDAAVARSRAGLNGDENIVVEVLGSFPFGGARDNGNWPHARDCAKFGLIAVDRILDLRYSIGFHRIGAVDYERLRNP